MYQFPDEAEYRTLDEVEELPTGVLTALTHCYSSLCGFLTSEGLLYECYSSSCPSRVKVSFLTFYGSEAELIN